VTQVLPLAPSDIRLPYQLVKPRLNLHSRFSATETDHAGTEPGTGRTGTFEAHRPAADAETVESWADRNGLTYGTARAWAMKGVLPTVKLGKRRMAELAI